MALAEARAAWQRTANRCLVQEDAKRAPKLAYCSSVPPSVKQSETGPTTAAGGQDIPSSNSLPFHRSPSYSNLSPNTKWWLQTQPNYGCQRGLMDEKLRSPEGNTENVQVGESLAGVTRNEDDYELVSQASHIESPFDNQCKDFVTCENKGIEVKEEKLRSIYHLKNCQDPVKIEFEDDMEELRNIGIISSEGSKSSGDLYFDSDSSWVVTEKSTPWWRTADTEELALLVAQRSLDLIENCDLPSPQNVHVKKKSTNISSLGHSDVSASLPVPSNLRSDTHDSAPATLAGSSYRNLRMVNKEQLLSSPKYSLRDSPTQGMNRECKMHEDDAGKAQLLEALRHSQTRAREAETVAKQVCAEKEHVVKLVFRQAQQLFAYKQLVQLLQLENMYFQLKNNKIMSAAATSPAISPWTTPGNRKKQKGWMKSSSRNRAKRRRPRYDVGRYAIVFALGLGLVGAGLLLGWTIGWMLPTW